MKFYLRKNDSDTEVAESCYPTANDMLRRGESDTDPDMPSLKTIEDLPREERRGSMTVGEHAESLNSIRQLLAMHTSVVEEDYIVIEETRLEKDMAAVEKGCGRLGNCAAINRL